MQGNKVFRGSGNKVLRGKVFRGSEKHTDLVLLWLKVLFRKSLPTCVEENLEQLKTIVEPLDEVLATRCLGNTRDRVSQNAYGGNPNVPEQPV